MTRLEFGDSLATYLDMAVYDSLVIRQAGQRSDKTRWPNRRFMEGRITLWWAGLRGKEYLPYKELRPGLVSGLY